MPKVGAQVFNNDSELLQLSMEATHAVYNWEFDKTKVVATKIKEKIPGHPANYFLEALTLYWQNFPFDFESEVYRKHMALLQKVSDKSEEVLEENPDDYEAKFFLLSAKSMMLRNWDDDGSTMKVIGELREMYKLFVASSELKKNYSEFSLPSGLYNFYREFYAEEKPVYKPVLFFFKSGDVEEGMKEIKYAAENASYSKAEAYFYLCYIYYRYLDDSAKALEFQHKLMELYPNNLFYVFKSAEILVLEGKYQKAKPLIAKLCASDKVYYKLAGMTLSGLIEELYHKNNEKAWEIYAECEDMLEKVNTPYARFFKTYIYVGISDFYHEKGDVHNAKKYYKLAKEFDEWGYLKSE
ncbi:hypothetical protein R9C00_27940 [Flammeovirgaceae bacterium SG7u.111]|nr:hypothetical protein [Flammeovirgaceae bacterium SG7u.132]WPO35532.1 hypothetical protein R9C00_27940 [Flammeovirgaceae bacterium SG7u.111]